MENKTILITPREAQKILGVARNKIYSLLKQEDFPAFKMGENFYINRELLNEWAKKQCAKKK